MHSFLGVITKLDFLSFHGSFLYVCAPGLGKRIKAEKMIVSLGKDERLKIDRK